ncbi:MAG: hypothetical protein WCD86_01205 [Ktedonobacteraceae bacterium]
MENKWQEIKITPATDEEYAILMLNIPGSNTMYVGYCVPGITGNQVDLS